MIWSIVLAVWLALANTQYVLTDTKIPRTKLNLFAPVLSANAYVGHLKENERLVQLDQRLYASDADSSTSLNGKICGFELSLHKHDDVLDDITKSIPFIVEFENNQAVIKLKSNSDSLDCEVKQTHRLYIRAYDCAPAEKRRYSERSSLIITVDDVNEYAPVFTHNHYLFKLHQDQTCDASSCRVEATDDDCTNQDHRVCGYEILTRGVPFTIDSNGAITSTKILDQDQYDFQVIAIDCYPSKENTRVVSLPARVTVKMIKSCTPSILDDAPAKLLVQSDRIHLFDTVDVNTCDDTCNVEDIVGTVELDSHGLDSGCDPRQCSTTDREYVLLAKDTNNKKGAPVRFSSFNGYDHAMVVNQSHFSGHLNNEFTIRMWMKRNGEEKIGNEKEHIFCKSDEKLKNRHHTALFLHNNYIKLLIRKGPISSNDRTMYTSEWMWKVPQINDNQWHAYRFHVNYPNKIDFYVDDQLIVPTADNFRSINDHPLTVIDGTEDTIFALGACWHARASRFVQHFHGQLSGLVIEQKEELQRSSTCIRDCHQYLDMLDIQPEEGVEFVSNANRSMWILRADTTNSYRKLLKHLVYRNTFQPIGPSGQRLVSIRTRVKCLGEITSSDLPTFTRFIAINQPQLPAKIELRSEPSYFVPEAAMSQGIYLFRSLAIYTNAIKKSLADISECSLTTTPLLTNSEQLIVPDTNSLAKEISKEGLTISGIGSIDAYQHLLRQIAYISRAPVAYTERVFTLSCAGVQDEVSTNKIHVRVRIEKQSAPLPPAAAVLSDKFYVNNDQIRDNTFDISDLTPTSKRSISDWPIAVIICVSIGLAGVLVLYLIVRIRSTNRQQHSTTNNADDLHSQMEWEDDIGLNITVNPLDETKKPADAVHTHNLDQNLNEYPGVSSDDEEYENNGYHQSGYSTEEDEEKSNPTHAKKLDHQLEWDDAAIEYGPKKV